MLHLLRLTLCLALIAMLFPVCARAGDKLPEVGSIPGVDTEKLQQRIDSFQKELQDVKKGKGGMKIILPSKKQEALGKKEADQAMAAFQLKMMKERIRKEEIRILKKNAPGKKTQLLISPEQAPFGKWPMPPAGGTVFVFLSSSMPEETIHTYIAQASLYGNSGIVPVFYGFPGGLDHKAEAGRYFIHLLQHDLGCHDKKGTLCPRYRIKMLVNPDVFKRFGVTVVPTIVYATAKGSWRMEGDASLGYILSRINRQAHSRYLDRMVKRLRGGDNDRSEN